ncbi:MAG: hypothetical protein ACYS9C_17670, partial [Planctomycetota bacterium]
VSYCSIEKYALYHISPRSLRTRRLMENKANFKPGFGIDVGGYSCDIIMIVFGNQPGTGPPIRVADRSRSLFRILQ